MTVILILFAKSFSALILVPI